MRKNRSIYARLGDLIYAVTGRQFGSTRLPTDHETENAIASVLALAAMSDGIVSTEEIERLVIILRREFSLDAGTALSHITDAIHGLPERSSMGRLMDELNGLLGTRNKEDFIVMLLEVIAADGRKDAQEMEVLAHTVHGLNVSQKCMQRAYLRYHSSRRGRANQAR